MVRNRKELDMTEVIESAHTYVIYHILLVHFHQWTLGLLSPLGSQLSSYTSFFSQQLQWPTKQPRVDFLPLTGLHKELELWYQQRPLAPICLLKECRRIWLSLSWFLGFPGASAGKESACNVGNLGLITGLGRSPGEGKGYPCQYSGLENSMDYIVHGVTKSWTRLSDFFFTSLHLLAIVNSTAISIILFLFWSSKTHLE